MLRTSQRRLDLRTGCALVPITAHVTLPPTLGASVSASSPATRAGHCGTPGTTSASRAPWSPPALDTTRALLDNWSHGWELHPVRPRRAQIAAVHARWLGPITFSPSHATKAGLGGR